MVPILFYFFSFYDTHQIKLKKITDQRNDSVDFVESSRLKLFSIKNLRRNDRPC